MSRLQVGGLALIIKANNPENLGLTVTLVGFFDGEWDVKSNELSNSHAKGCEVFAKRFCCPPTWLMPLGDDQTQAEFRKELDELVF